MHIFFEFTIINSELVGGYNFLFIHTHAALSTTTFIFKYLFSVLA